MSDKKIEFTLELSNAIDKIAEKLGMGAGTIIPEYVKLEKIRGFVWIGGGILLAITVPILVAFLWPDVIALDDRYYSIGNTRFKTAEYRGYLEGMGVLSFLGVVGVGAGISMILHNIERVIAPKSLAISKLLRQVR